MAKERNSKISINLWAAIRDVLNHSITKGQFPLACVAGIVVLCVWRMPAADVTALVNRILSVLDRFAFFSYLGNVILVAGWAMHARHQRKLFTGELNRVGQEKSDLQEQLLSRKLSSSNKPQ